MAGCQRESSIPKTTFYFSDNDRVAGYLCSASYDRLTETISGPVLCKYNGDKVRQLILDDKIDKNSFGYPMYFSDKFVGTKSSFHADVGEIILYNHLEDSFSKIGNFNVYESRSDIRKVIESCLLAVVPETDKRSLKDRWMASPYSEGREIEDIVFLEADESKEFTIQSDKPYWVGFFVENIDEISKDPGNIELNPIENRSSVSGLPQVATVCSPQNGYLKFTIFNKTNFGTDLIIFINKEKDVPPNIR